MQQKTGHERFQCRPLDRVLQPQPLAKAQPLGAQVEIERLDFLAQGDFLHRILVERVAQEFREPGDGVVGRAVLIVENQGGDGVQGVEQEMRVQLVAQHLELRFLRERHGLQNRLLLLLLGFVVADAEVESAPTQQQVGGGHGAAEQLEQGLELPVGLDELFVGEVDDRA